MSEFERPGARRRSLLVLGVAAAAVVLIVVGVVALTAPATGDGELAQPDPSPDPDPGGEADPEPEPDAEPEPDPEPVETEPEETGSTSDDAGPADAAPARGRLVIHHVGDVSLDASYVPVLASGDPAGAWDGVRDTFADAHLVIVNLECAATDGGVPQDKQFVFRCSLDALPAMRDAGVDVATLANNHTGDYGIQGMVDSVDNVEAAGIATVGVGSNEQEAHAPHIVEVEGWRVAVVGFGGVVPVAEWTAWGDRPGQATGYDPARMAASIAAVRDDVDIVVATVHWGAEGSFEPRPEDVVKAQAMIDAGADVVFGHHAHRLQPLEVVEGAPVFWNLGNFVWPRTSPEAAVTAVGEFAVEPDGSVRSCLLPFDIDTAGVPRPTGEDRRCEDSTLR